MKLKTNDESEYKVWRGQKKQIHDMPLNNEPSAALQRTFSGLAFVPFWVACVSDGMTPNPC
jgi:hypothetical protein